MEYDSTYEDNVVPEDPSPDEKQWSMFIHLSQFAGYVVPLAGLIVPIVLWQMKKEDSNYIDAHGKIVTNWIISSFIYAVISVLLFFFFIGMPLLFVLILLSIVFPIIGGVKANNNKIWCYPMTITFIK